MKRTSFIVSAASAAFLCSPLPAKAGYLTQAASSEANTETSVWRNPAWFCGSAVVWLDAASGVYRYKGDRRYGCTEHGAYMCEREAIAAGYRATVETVKKR